MGGGVEQSATYKILDVHPIIGKALDKRAFFRTHAAAVWYNKLAGRTAKDEIAELKQASSQLNSKFEYRSLMNEITILDSSAASVIYAYTENGTVLIAFSLRPGVRGAIQIAKINAQFTPRTFVGGTYVCLSSGMDRDKIASAYIDDQGKVTVWFLEDLSYGERLTFVYPLRG